MPPPRRHHWAPPSARTTLPWSAGRAALEAEVALLEVVWVVGEFVLGKLHLQERLELEHEPTAPAFTRGRHQDQRSAVVLAALIDHGT